MINLALFPKLTKSNHRVTSPPDTDYNCIAWAAGDLRNWWQPGDYWPKEIPLGAGTPEELESAFEEIGYRPCADASLESGFTKIALYSDGEYYTHAARQLPNGNWTSKLGYEEDIEHNEPADVAGGYYGEVFRFMKRTVT